MNLAELIQASRGDRSYDQLSKATIGFNPKNPDEPVIQAARMHQIATSPLVQPPNKETVKGIAHALAVPELTVWLAVGESLGFDTETSRRGTPFEDLMPSGVTELPPSAIAALRQLVQQMVNLHRAAKVR